MCSKIRRMGRLWLGTSGAAERLSGVGIGARGHKDLDGDVFDLRDLTHANPEGDVDDGVGDGLVSGIVSVPST